MLILGLNKTTLLDYPEHVAATIFTGGCNFRCPYCHNKDLAACQEAYFPGHVITDEELFHFLKKRKNVLTGVCITGGEPTLQKDLPDFAGRLKALGYLVKLDTNGTNPAMLKALIDGGLIDYCAMDVKNSPQKYASTAGFDDTGNFQLAAINDSIHLLLRQSQIAYEFRTTVVKELHDAADMASISRWIAGAQGYFIQSYADSEGVLRPGFHAHTYETLVSFAALCRDYVPSAALRGVDEN